MYLVECYWPGVTGELARTAEVRAREVSADLRSSGREVAFLGSVVVPADETVFCFFEGCEADVRAASERARLPFERVLEAEPVQVGR